MSHHQRRPRRNRHFRIDQELKAEDRAPYCAYLRQPRTTNKSAHAWLTARGYDFSESAVARHMRQFLEGAHEQRITEQFALRLADLDGTGEVSSETFLRGAMLRADQLILEAIFGLKPMEGTTPAQVIEFCAGIERLIAVRRRLGRLEATLKGAGAREEDHSTPADPSQMNRIADRVREILAGHGGRGRSASEN